jgi:O-antigen/teichoic acid export membrane protein
VTPFSAFAYVLYGVFTIVTTGLNLESQTRRLPLIMGGAAIGNVALNLLLIPALGYLGAAISTLISYAGLAVAGGVVSQRVYAVPWEVGRVAALLGLGMALAAIALLGPDLLVWRLACIAAYPVVAVVFGIAPPGLTGSLLALTRR